MLFNAISFCMEFGGCVECTNGMQYSFDGEYCWNGRGVTLIWSSHMTWPTIWILDILKHKQAFFGPVFKPFDNWTWIYHFNTRLVRYSDGYCMSLLWAAPYEPLDWLRLTVQPPYQQENFLIIKCFAVNFWPHLNAA